MTLEDALAHFRAGRWAEARDAAEELAAADPKNAGALHVAGAASAQLGDIERAIAEVRRATQIDPNQADAWLDLARLLDISKRPDEALDALARVALLRPDAERFVHVADALYKRRRFPAAADFYRRAVALAPGDADLHNRLASALLELNDAAGGEAAAQEALRLDADFVAAHFNLGSALQHQGRLDEAADRYRRVIALKPRFALAHCNLGVVLQKQNRLADSIAAFRAAVEIDPKFALSLSNLGHMLALADELEEAERFSRRAVELEPNNSVFFNNLSTVLGRGRRYEEAIAFARRAIEIDPDNHLAHAQLGLCLLYVGRMREGWREFEWRSREWATTTGRKTWDGSPLNGRSIVLRAEQGYGDTIQFIRYAPLVHDQRGGRVLVECPPPLKELIETVRGVDAVHAWGEDPPAAAELEVWMMSLPDRFGTTRETIPADVPYVRHDPKRVEKFAPLLRHARGLKVGLNWAGNPDFPLDATRSTHLGRIAPLLDVPGITWVSLQKGPAQARDAALIRQHGLIDAASQCHDFADTAALMSQLDLIITTDTAPAHLGGALALPTWVLLEFHPEWRWLRDRSDNPWYPTARLFRQPTPGDWDAVVWDVRRALADRVNSPTP